MDKDFNSVERLVEFGLGIAVARQMVATMNHAIDNMSIPGAHNPVPAESKHIFVVIDGSQAGPFTSDELATLIRDGKVTEQTLVWQPGLTAWVVAEQLPETNKLLLLNK